MLKRKYRIGAAAALLSFCVMAATGCDQNLIDHASVNISDNLETIRLSLVFTSSVQSTFSGGLNIKDYGSLFVEPYSQTQPFTVGFYLNTSIVNDQDYIHLQPTDVLPNGVPTGIGYSVVEITSPQPISPDFNLYGYVDVLHGAWLGVASVFKFVTVKYFPQDLSISDVLLRDKQQLPTVIASVFGPKLNTDGTLQRAGGISLFANAKSLVNQLQARGLTPTHGIELRPEGAPFVTGANGEAVSVSPGNLKLLQKNIIEGLNSNRNSRP